MVALLVAMVFSVSAEDFNGDGTGDIAIAAGKTRGPVVALPPTTGDTCGIGWEFFYFFLN